MPALTHHKLLLAALIGLAIPSLAPVALAERTQADQAPRHYSIPAGSLSQALDHFARDSDLSVMMASERVRGLHSPGLQGSFAPEEALARLLEGSGLRAVRQDDRHFLLQEIEDAPKALELDSLTIYGDKSLRSVDDNPASVSVIDQQRIETGRIRDMRESFRLLPNVNASPSRGNNNGFTIRGINSEGLWGADGNQAPLSTLYIDGAPQSLEGVRRGLRGLWDVQQLEVLRGPQTTLGRNAMAGAVVVKTNDPTPYWEGAARASLGSGHSHDEAVMLSGPLTDDLSFRLAGEKLWEEKGIRYNLDELQYLQEGEYWQGRAKLLYTPSFVPGLSIQYGFARGKDDPAITSTTDARHRRYVMNSSEYHWLETRLNEVDNHVLDVRYPLSDRLTLESTTTFTETRTHFDTPTNVFVRDELREDRDLTQDLRLRVGHADDRLSGLFGVFYGRLRHSVDSEMKYLLGTDYLQLQSLEDQLDRDNLAAYSDLEYRLTPRLSLLAGLRYEYEKHDYDFLNRQTDAPFTGDTRFDALLPKLGLAYQLADNHRLALTATKGYRSGFIERNPQSREAFEVDPEHLWSYELASRSHWLDDRLRLNGNLFYYDWSDMQHTATGFCDNNGVPMPCAVTRNIGKAEAYGAELSLEATPLHNLDIRTAVGWLRTELTQHPEQEGNRFPEAPQWSGSLEVTYRFADHWFAGGDLSYKDWYYSTGSTLNARDQRIGSHSLTNLRLGYEQDNLLVVGELRNAFDRRYITASDQLGVDYVGDRRTANLSVQLRF